MLNAKALLVSMILSAGIVSHADEAAPVKTGDVSKVQQDKTVLKKDREDVKAINAQIKADKASGDQTKLKADRQTRRQLVQNRRQDKHQLHADKKASAQPAVSPAPSTTTTETKAQ